jgi:hypothetical protein
MSSILRSLVVDRESVVSDVRWGIAEGQSVRAAPCPAPSRHSAEFAGATAGHDHRPAPFKGRERNDAVHAVAADNAVLGSESVPCPKCNRRTVYLYRLST